MSRANVVVFITDGHRKDTLGCYGNSLLETPHIDDFAASGVRFERAFCTHSVCMPTRASLYTGRYPHVHGVWANGVRLPENEVTLPQVLGDEKYATCAAGKVHFEPQQSYAGNTVPAIQGPYYGFDEVHMSENKVGEEYLRFIDWQFPQLSERARERSQMPADAHELQWITDRAVDFINRQAEEKQPFYCHCSFHELCPPCNTPEEFAGHYDPADVPVPELRPEDLEGRPPFYRECYEGYLERDRQPDEETLRRYVASYYDQMRFIDHQFGRLMAALDDAGIADHTIVLFTADHGLSLNDHYQWRHGPFLFDQVTNIPMIWRLPGAQRTGFVTDAMVEGVDVMPTILDLCDAQIPAGVQGQSIADILQGGSNAGGRESVLLQERQAPDLAARGLDPDEISQWAVRTQDFKLIAYEGKPWGELYDLREDPGEFNNLWDDPQYASEKAAMRDLLLQRLMASRDPLPQRHHEW